MKEEPVFPLTALSEVQRAQALERYTIIHPALEDGVSQAQMDSLPVPYNAGSDSSGRKGLSDWQIMWHAQTKGRHEVSQSKQSS